MSVAFTEMLTFADLLDELGGISPSRVRLRPTPGKATEKDVIRIEAQENRLFELVDGVLVEKAMGARESFLATHISFLLKVFLQNNDLGAVLDPDVSEGQHAHRTFRGGWAQAKLVRLQACRARSMITASSEIQTT